MRTETPYGKLLSLMVPKMEGHEYYLVSSGVNAELEGENISRAANKFCVNKMASEFDLWHAPPGSMHDADVCWIAQVQPAVN